MPIWLVLGIGSAALFLLEKVLPSKDNAKNDISTVIEETSNDDLSETSRRDSGRPGSSKPGSPNQSNRQSVTDTGSEHLSSADSVETVGEDSTQEEHDHASRQTSTHTNDRPVQQREPGTEKPESGDAVSTPET